MVRRERTANQARGPGAGAKRIHGPERGFLEPRVIGQAEIIVRRKIQQRLSADLDAGALRRIHAAQPAEQALAADGGEALLQFCVEGHHG